MNTNPHGAPWYKYGHVWLVIAGPAMVVVAALATAWIAVRSPDPVLEEDYYRRGIEINQSLANKKLMPALTGRNHAVTPDSDVPAPRR